MWGSEVSVRVCVRVRAHARARVCVLGKLGITI